MFNRLLSTNLSEYVNPDVSILILRIGAAALMLTHGYPKLMNILAGEMGFADPIGLGPATTLLLVTFAEFVCSILVLLGVWTRVALIPLLLDTFGIVFIAHAGDPFSQKEKGLLFMLMFIVLFLTGAGRYSVDHKLYGRPRV